MARTANKLTVRAVETIKEPGLHSDGRGLYLAVSPTGAKSWRFIYRRVGKRTEVGLGKFPDVSLAAARKRVDDAREALAAGNDPLALRRAAKASEAGAVSFGAFADELVEEIRAGFRNEKHRAQWAMTLGDAYCRDLRKKPIHEVTTEDILAVLKPVWLTKAETASRIRGRIERVLDAARAKGLRSGENPARWRGHLDHLLPKRLRLQRGHHAAMPYEAVPAFIERLRARESNAAPLLELTILTAARSGEALGARWSEFDLKRAIWTIPPNRMKAGREHRVPLSARALAILESMQALRREDEADGYVFPGQKRGRPLSAMTMEMLLRRMDVDFTVHGFRSSFRDWCGEETSFPRDVAEAALAHVIENKTEAAYRRGDALEKRRRLMEAWAAYIEPKAAGNVVSLKRGRGAA